MLAWEQKAHTIIGQLSFEAFDKANPKNKFGSRPKKQKPYTIPQTADELVKILGMVDRKEAEEMAKVIFWRLLIIPESA